MEENEIKRANRKALPRFIMVMVLCLIVGGTVGYLSGRFRLDLFADNLRGAGAFFGAYIAPWLMVSMAVLMPIVCALIYRSSKRLLSVWDGEDEDIAERVDRKLSCVIWISSAALIFSYFLIAAAYSDGVATFGNKRHTVVFSLAVAAFLAIMIEAVVIQQKCVDAAKQMNPEKKASVYDMHFQKKWMDSCDEAEKIMVGKCAYKAYSATNTVCAVLAIGLAVCALIFEIGFLPSFAVCLVWMVNLSAYCREAMRYSKAGNKISRV